MAEFNAYELLAKLRGGQAFPDGGSSPQPAETGANPTNVQKKERVEVRVELEKDIIKLNEEIVKLKAQNKTLVAEKAELTNKLTEQKKSSDHTIKHLRQEIVMLRKRINTGGGRDVGVFNNFDGTGASNRLAVATRNSAFPLTNPAINRQLQYMPPPPPGQLGATGVFEQENMSRSSNSGSPGASPNKLGSSQPQTPGQQGQGQGQGQWSNSTTKCTLRRNSNFAGPTFSELMRRSAPVYKDFKTSLRDKNAFYTTTPTVLTNANQDPEVVNIRKSICMTAAQQGAVAAAAAAAAAGVTTHSDGHMGAGGGYGAEEEDDSVPISAKTPQHKPFSGTGGGSGSGSMAGSGGRQQHHSYNGEGGGNGSGGGAVEVDLRDVPTHGSHYAT